MKVDFNTVIRDVRGKAVPLLGPDGSSAANATLADIALQALDAQDPNGDQSSEAKIRAFKLMVRIAGAGAAPMDVDATEAALIIQKTGKFFSPTVVGRVNEILSGDGS